MVGLVDSCVYHLLLDEVWMWHEGICGWSGFSTIRMVFLILINFKLYVAKEA